MNISRLSLFAILLFASGCTPLAPAFRISDATTGASVSDLELTARPMPKVYLAGIPKVREYRTDADGFVSLDNLPSGLDSILLIDGYPVTLEMAPGYLGRTVKEYIKDRTTTISSANDLDPSAPKIKIEFVDPYRESIWLQYRTLFEIAH